MSDGFLISIDPSKFKSQGYNFFGRKLIEFFRNPGDEAMIEIYEFLEDLFRPYVPYDTGKLVDSKIGRAHV